MKLRVNGGGYYHISFCKNNKCKTFNIYRLIAINFIPNPENKPQVNHIDGNKLNNHVNNLEWCTRSENMQHAWKLDLYKNSRKATKKYKSKKVMCIETGINHSNISKCCKGKLKSAGKKIINGKKIKLTWQYI